jgi:hypothetical protein
MKPTLTDDHVFRIIGAVVLVLGLLILVALRGVPQRPDRCPIDGQVAEWTKRSGENSCDYGHFSAIERATHMWSAACP